VIEEHSRRSLLEVLLVAEDKAAAAGGAVKYFIITGWATHLPISFRPSTAARTAIWLTRPSSSLLLATKRPLDSLWMKPMEGEVPGTADNSQASSVAGTWYKNKGGSLVVQVGR